MLLGVVVIDRLLDGPDFIGVLGPIHGILFLVYFFLVLRMRDNQGWGLLTHGRRPRGLGIS